MNNGLNDFLNKFDSQYQSTKTTVKSEEKLDSYEDISDGRYVAYICGQGWRDYQNQNPDAWSGMGPTLRLRIVSGRNKEVSRFAGWKEDITYFLFSVHPDRGINSPELNEKKLGFFLRQMDRIQANPPSKMGELAGWEGAVGMAVFITIQTKKDGDRTYRNVYFDGRADHVSEGVFPSEKFVDQRWEKVEGSGVAPQAPTWPSTNNEMDDIPF